MPNKIFQNYYPVPQKFFQDLLSRFSLPLSRALSNLAKNLKLPQWFSPLLIPFCTALSSFTRFLGQNIWALEEVAGIALEQFFHTLRIKTHSEKFGPKKIQNFSYLKIYNF